MFDAPSTKQAAELLAEAAGAVSGPCPPEWGFREVELTSAAAEDELLGALPERFEVFQAHNFGFELPAGLQHLFDAVDSFQIELVDDSILDRPATQNSNEQ